MNTIDRILKKHRIVPKKEIYHLTNDLTKILRDNILDTRIDSMLSLTANRSLKRIFPESEERKFRLVLNYPLLKRDFNIFPVYYFTDVEFYEYKPYGWLVQYYLRKGLTLEELEGWNTSTVYLCSGELLGFECEWKSLHSIVPLESYLLRVERITEG